MKRYEQYYEAILDIEQTILQEEADVIEKVACQMTAVLKEEKALRLFGCGHSHILVEEAFYRAGGLVNVHPIFDTALMLHEGAVKSSQLERLESYGDWVFDRNPMEPGDLLFVFSNSGINGCPVEMAKRAQEQGVQVVAVTSRNYLTAEKSRHSSGKHLADFADFVIDTHIPCGDALVETEDNPIAPGSTIACSLIWNMLISELSEESEKQGVEADYFVSGNVTGGAERNQKYIEKYRNQIPNL